MHQLYQGLGIVKKNNKKNSKSIPIPVLERYFDTNFINSILTRLNYLKKKKKVLFFQLVEVYTDSKTHLLSHCTKEPNVTNTNQINQKSPAQIFDFAHCFLKKYRHA